MPKKKSSRKPKLPKKPGPVAEECIEYMEATSEFVCEIDTYLRRHPPAKEWMERVIHETPWLNRKMERHHVFGRGDIDKRPEKHWFCSLIQISAVCHKYNDNVNKFHVEVCCLFSKLARHTRYLELSDAGIVPVETDTSRLFWHTKSMDDACNYDSILGRIEGILIPEVSGTIFENMAIKTVKLAKELK